MNTTRISLGFDLRIDPRLQVENPLQKDQNLVPEQRSPVSADAMVWRETDEIEALTEGMLPDFANPLHLARSIDLLIDACRKRGISTVGLWPVCITTLETNLIALTARFGSEYFDGQGEEELLTLGWHLLGFDVADLGGLISGLKGCGYKEPTWSQLRSRFASELNDVGLFRDCDMARRFAEVRGLEIREHAPFVVVGVTTKEPLR